MSEMTKKMLSEKTTPSHLLRPLKNGTICTFFNGLIEPFAHLSQFTSGKEFNKSVAAALDIYGHHFTKGKEFIYSIDSF